MKNYFYTVVLFAISVLTNVGCSKHDVPRVDDFTAVRNSIRAWNEVSAIAEILDNTLQPQISGIVTYLELDTTMSITPSQIDTNTFVVDFGDSTMCHDRRFRRGKIIYGFSGQINDSNNVFFVSFDNYSCNNVQVSGNLTITEGARALLYTSNTSARKKQIIGIIQFILFDGTSFMAQPNITRDYSSQIQYYDGSLNGVDALGLSFQSYTEEQLKKSEYNGICPTYFYGGKYVLSNTIQTGKVWMGYTDTCDDHGFAEWNGSKFNFFLYQY
jgi:hypothetical protein